MEVVPAILVAQADMVTTGACLCGCVVLVMMAVRAVGLVACACP